MPTVKFALVGCGRVSRKHVDAVTHVDGAELAAVCDVIPERARALAVELGVPWFAGASEMLAAVPAIEVVSVLTPTGHHKHHALLAAAAGKHVIVEKPIAMRTSDADEMIAACARAGVQLFVVKPTRYHAPVRELRRAVDRGDFGAMVEGTVRLRWCRRQDYYDRDPWRGKADLDGGVLMNQASHYIDLLAWMLGPVESVYAMTAQRLAKIESEDTAAGVLRFASGALGIIEATTATRPTDLECSLSVLGERGSVVIGGFSADQLVTWAFEHEVARDDAPAESGHRAFVRDVVAALRGKPTQVVDGHEARKCLEIIEALYESARTHREVVLGHRPATT